MKQRAFTLIELLIVVAIIAILAAIAVPNFLEAQTRAKVSRCKADLRSVATGLEAYYVDYNQYPSACEAHNQHSWVLNAGNNTPPFHSRQPSMLTTPIAYMTSLPEDAFRSSKIVLTDPYLKLFNKRYIYFNFPYLRISYPTSFTSATNFGHAEPLAGKWLFYGVGPDQDEFNRIPLTGALVGKNVYIDYDPTNGTISRGNVFRTQNSGEKLGVDSFFTS
jgi:type II secretion system protein G